VEEVAAFLTRGEKPRPVVTHEAASFPPLAELRPIA
jgi:hypothetical protein